MYASIEAATEASINMINIHAALFLDFFFISHFPFLQIIYHIIYHFSMVDF